MMRDDLSLNNRANPFSKLTKRQQGFYSRYEGEIDEYGFDVNTFAKWEPFFRFFYQEYFQVKVLGLENIPDEGRAILVGNHSGVLPIDAFMLQNGVFHLHPSPRRIRALAHDWLRHAPGVKDVICGMGGVPATFATARKLLDNEELVCFYPEGARGTGKPFSMRYRLIDFDPGFVKAAILTNSPIVPVITVGGDEIYPLLATSKPIARLLGWPYYPFTLMFPWLPFPVSCIPLPIKMLIKIGKPIHLNYPADKAEDRKLRLRLTREIQYEIQKELNLLLSKRKSPFAGWDVESLPEL
jgi:1-acyl-sn-glycerol-3-phosphate acyltransferase